MQDVNRELVAHSSGLEALAVESETNLIRQSRCTMLVHQHSLVVVEHTSMMQNARCFRILSSYRRQPTWPSRRIAPFAADCDEEKNRT